MFSHLIEEAKIAGEAVAIMAVVLPTGKTFYCRMKWVDSPTEQLRFATIAARLLHKKTHSDASNEADE